jgi:hypothetical protein
MDGFAFFLTIPEYPVVSSLVGRALDDRLIVAYIVMLEYNHFHGLR